MKIWSKDIFQFLKTTICVLLVVLCLCSCKEGSNNINVMTLEGEQSDLDLEDEVEEQQRSCWQAQFLELFYNAMAESSMKAYPKVTGSAMPFMMVAFALWLSIRILKHVSSVVEESPAEVWTEVARMAFICLCCGLIASSTGFLLFVLNKLILPIYYAFLEYGSLVLNALTTDGDINSPGIYLGEPGKGYCAIYTNSLVCAAPKLEAATLNSFPKEPADMMQCLTCAVSDRMQLGFVIAKNLLSGSTFSMVLSGIVVYAVFMIVKIAFVFYIVDSIFRMNMMVILLPCFVLAYPFKFSRKWTKEGFLMMINSAAILAFMAIIAAVAMLAMQIILANNSSLLGDRDLYNEFGLTSLMMILISFLVLKSITMAIQLSSSLVGGGGSSNFQRRIAKLGASIAKRAFSFVTGKIGKVFSNTSAGQKLKERREHARKVLEKISGRGGNE